MNRVELCNRTEVHVEKFFWGIQDSEICRIFPFQTRSLEDALQDYYCSLSFNSQCYRCTIYVDDIYVGDIWCDGVDLAASPQTMLNYCLFEKQYWGQAIATTAVKLFVQEISEKLRITNVGALTYTNNVAAISVLENCDFELVDNFVEDGEAFSYFELDISTLSVEEKIALATKKANNIDSDAGNNDEMILEKGYPRLRPKGKDLEI